MPGTTEPSVLDVAPNIHPTSALTLLFFSVSFALARGCKVDSKKPHRLTGGALMFQADKGESGFEFNSSLAPLFLSIYTI